MAGCGDVCGADLAQANRHERRILIIVLLINAGMFVAEFSAGLVSGSTADSLCMAHRPGGQGIIADDG